MGLGKSIKSAGHHVSKACHKVTNPVKKGVSNVCSKTGISKVGNYAKGIFSVVPGYGTLALTGSYYGGNYNGQIGDILANSSNYQSNAGNDFTKKYFNQNVMNAFMNMV